MVTTFLRFKDLKARGIVVSWPSLRYKIEHSGFPPGRYLGPNTRAWTADEVQAWIDALPTENPRKAAAKAQEAA
jgi:predicted DNA-binding transcriptional regulator AlpA